MLSAYELVQKLNDIEYNNFLISEFSITLDKNKDFEFAELNIKTHIIANTMFEMFNKLSYLEELLGVTKILTKQDKSFIIKRDLTQLSYDTIKKQYDMLSRIATLYLEEIEQKVDKGFISKNSRMYDVG